MTSRSGGSLKVEFVDNASTQYDENAARIKYSGYKDGGKLYIGDNSAASYVQLKHRKCKVVVSCSRDLHGFCKEPDVTYLKIDPEDDAEAARSDSNSSSSSKKKKGSGSEECKSLQRACDFLCEHLLQKKTHVLVHCENGLSRSAAVLLYFLMAQCGQSLAEAYTMLRHARGEVRIGNAVMKLLLRAELRLRGSNTVRLDGRQVVLDAQAMKLASTARQSSGKGSSSSSSARYVVAIAIVVIFFAAVFGGIYLATGKL